MEEYSTELIDKAKSHVSELFAAELSNKYVYHNLNHTRQTAEACAEAAEAYSLSPEEREALLLAAWFHDTGYTKKYEGHEESSIAIAQKFLADEGYPQERTQLVSRLIKSTTAGHKSADLLEEILHDADRISIGKKSFFRKAELLRIEWEVFLDKHYKQGEWDKIQQQYILNTNFYTDFFRKKYGDRREKNINKQRETLKKLKKNKAKDDDPKRGVETMYRATYRNHIELSAIADSKANMMISINTIIMSVIITVVGGGFTLTEQAFIENLRFTVPIGILLIGSLTSVIYAVISARPNVTEKKVDLEKIKNKQSSSLFFGNFTQMKLKEFIENMQKLASSKTLLYDSMTIDIYYLGLVLTQKYRMLRISYNVFMGALVLTVLAFIAIFIYTQSQGPPMLTPTPTP
ncbi:MAG: HD domain-containing protein [Bacteroidetes bacterium]|nr:HD domain-containing protein [Bacteroidota bacterium]